MAHHVFLALGTNLGDRLFNLQMAFQSLLPVCSPVKESSVYETDPWGFLDQPAFLNQVLEMKTDLSPTILLNYIKQAENNIGREATFHYGPRLIDMDILFYDQLVTHTPRLTIPHPHIAERAFVLVPLAEIAPDFQHPLLALTIQELLQKVDCRGVKLFQP